MQEDAYEESRAQVWHVSAMHKFGTTVQNLGTIVQTISSTWDNFFLLKHMFILLKKTPKQTILTQDLKRLIQLNVQLDILNHH